MRVTTTTGRGPVATISGEQVNAEFSHLMWTNFSGLDTSSNPTPSASSTASADPNALVPQQYAPAAAESGDEALARHIIGQGPMPDGLNEPQPPCVSECDVRGPDGPLLFAELYGDVMGVGACSYHFSLSGCGISIVAWALPPLKAAKAARALRGADAFAEGANGLRAGTAANSVTRSLDELSSLRGATPDDIRGLVPEGWIEKPLKKGGGVRFLNPKRPGESISIEDGWPGHADPLHSGPYVKISRDGTIERIPLQGNPVLGD